MKRKLLAAVLTLCLCSSLLLPAAASEMGQLESYGVSLIQYYQHHQEAAEDVIWDITRQMKEIDRKQLSTAAGRIGTITWREINV